MSRLVLRVKFLIDITGSGKKTEKYLYTNTIRFMDDGKAFLDDNTYIETSDIVKIDPINISV